MTIGLLRSLHLHADKWAPSPSIPLKDLMAQVRLPAQLHSCPPTDVCVCACGVHLAHSALRTGLQLCVRGHARPVLRGAIRWLVPCMPSVVLWVLLVWCFFGACVCGSRLHRPMVGVLAWGPYLI